MEKAKQQKRVTERRVGGSYTLADWLDFRDLSHSAVYRLWAQGKGPARTRIGGRVIITDESDQAFVRANTEPQLT